MTEDIFDRITARAQPAAPVDNHKDEPPGGAPEQADRTPRDVRQCCQELMKFGWLEMEQKPRLYQTALAQHPLVNRLLEPFDLRMQLDEIRGLAFLQVGREMEHEEDDWSHPLVRRQRLTLEQSLLVAILRKRFLNHEQEQGVGAGQAEVYVDELIPELQMFLGELGSDRKEWERVNKLLDKLKGHGLVSGVDEQDRVCIRPIIAHLANPETLKALLQQYRALAEEKGGKT